MTQQQNKKRERVRVTPNSLPTALARGLISDQDSFFRQLQQFTFDLTRKLLHSKTSH